MIRNQLSTSAYTLATSDDLIWFMAQVSIGIAIELNLFKILVKARKPYALDELTRGTVADTVLLGILSIKYTHYPRRST